MEPLIIFYLLNTTFLLLHEMESAFEKEWEILHIPGNITGFLIIHIPIIFLFFYGALEIERRTQIGLIWGLISGSCGLVPFIIHKMIVRRKEHFNRLISDVIIYLSMITGIGTVLLAARLAYL